MKIGIVRHFKVDYKAKKVMSSNDFEEYTRDYDTASVIKTDLLREVKMYPIIKCRFKIPAFIWSIFSRIAWKLNDKSQLEGNKKTILRVKKFLSSIDLEEDESILIVSHGFFLITLVNELKLLGFKGDVPKKMSNGVIYVLEK